MLLATGYGIGWAQQNVAIERVIKTSVTAADQPIEFPPSPEITALTIDLPAGMSNLGFHKHPYQRLVYILDGALTVERDGGETKTYHAGSMLVEMRELWHSRSRKTSTPSCWS